MRPSRACHYVSQDGRRWHPDYCIHHASKRLLGTHLKNKYGTLEEHIARSPIFTCVFGQEVHIGLGVVLQLIGLNHDIGGGAKGSINARRRCHDARVRQRKPVALLA